ncbi:MAG: hypothetical protein K8S56_09055, partial [Candidatus Cloacimonetes bacterium]|nr:hypothetical protein [Candidatus Cloacimonadota bacterium]
MKRVILGILVLFLTVGIYGNGVAIRNAEINDCLRLFKTETDVVIDNQVSIVTTRQYFHNLDNYDAAVKYAYPMRESASATALSYYANGIWHQATIEPVPADTTMPGPGGNVHNNLQNYLGTIPLYFNPSGGINVDTNSTLIVELTYVELLPYEFGDIFFTCKNDHSLIQTSALGSLRLHFILTSDRLIDDFTMISNHPYTYYDQQAYMVELIFDQQNMVANEDYEASYTLNSDQLGMFSMSTFL